MVRLTLDVHSQVRLDDVVCTHLLQERLQRPPDFAAEGRTLTALSAALANSPATLLQRVADIVLHHFGAGSAGISLLSEDRSTFQWPAIAGAWAGHVGHGIAADASPCGVVVERQAVQLMVQPQRLFEGARDPQHPMQEVMLAPFRVDGTVVGTVWVISHDPARHFDAEDRRQLEGISAFTSAAYQIHQTMVAQERQNEELKASHARRSFLLTLSDVLQPLSNAADIHAAAMRVVGEHLGVTRAQFYEVSPDGEHLLASDGFSDGAAPIGQPLRMDDFGRFLKDTMRSGRTLAVADVTRDPRVGPKEREVYDQLGFRSFVGVPVMRGGRFVGGLGLHHAVPRAWSAADLAIAEEVTERAWAAIERARSEAALRDADRRKDEFLALLAHELRNPLAAIRNAGQVLGRPHAEPATVRSAAAILNRQVAHMVRQVDDLLDVSRISRGKIDLRKECIDLGTVIRHAIEAGRGFEPAKGPEIVVTVPAHPVRVEGDAVRLTQVVGNLLNNAIKFTDRSGRIFIVLEESGGQAVVRVRDTGIGIAVDQLPRIFEVFAQVDDGRDRAHDGLGLGLWLVRSFVQMHGGTVEASSRGIGTGAEFIIRIPMLPPTRSPAADAADPPIAGSADARRVLIVDDNVDAAQSLAMVLQAMGHEVETAYDGLDAVAKAQQWAPSVILMDIGMPRLDGYGAARQIRARDPKVLLVALTGWGQQGDRRRSADAGFDAHLVKPVEIGELTRLIVQRRSDAPAM
jgi:signal transduction histidine kinase/CheY-like chemotaxis protein/putative methionine-R-sulfoxide reductase with GAF domain